MSAPEVPPSAPRNEDPMEYVHKEAPENQEPVGPDDQSDALVEEKGTLVSQGIILKEDAEDLDDNDSYHSCSDENYATPTDQDGNSSGEDSEKEVCRRRREASEEGDTEKEVVDEGEETEVKDKEVMNEGQEEESEVKEKIKDNEEEGKALMEEGVEVAKKGDEETGKLEDEGNVEEEVEKEKAGDKKKEGKGGSEKKAGDEKKEGNGGSEEEANADDDTSGKEEWKEEDGDGSDTIEEAEGDEEVEDDEWKVRATNHVTNIS